MVLVSSTRVCPACGAPAAEGVQFCESCGQPMPVSRVCPKCGGPLPAAGKFCEQCGAPAEAPAAAPSPAAAPPPPPPPPLAEAPASPPPAPAPAGKPKWIIGLVMAVMVVLAIGAYTVAGPMLTGKGGSGVTPTPTTTLPPVTTLAPPTTTVSPRATVTRTPVAPTLSADFTASPVSGQVPFTVQFTDRTTGNPASWTWDFGDGGSSTLQNPSHTYTFAGTFGVRLTVQGSAGSDTEYRTQLVTVTEKVQPPDAVFTASLFSGTAPLSVQFTDQSTGSPTIWTWAFGDGSTSSLRNPAHTYTNPGTYLAEVTVANSAGTDSAQQTVTVTAPATTAPPTTTTVPPTTTAPPTTTTPPITGSYTGGWTVYIGANEPYTAIFDPPLGSSVSGSMGTDIMTIYELPGTLSPDGRTLEGTWDKIVTGETGTFRFVLAQDGNTFSGIWVEDGVTFPATGEVQLI
jgi:PKD repeat protein